MPHYGSTYGVQATQLIFKGGLVNKSIEMAGLREQLSELDLEKNSIRSKEIREINTPSSKTKILVVPTNEEVEIANQVYDLLS